MPSFELSSSEKGLYSYYRNGNAKEFPFVLMKICGNERYRARC